MGRLTVQVTVDEETIRTMQKTMDDKSIFNVIQTAVDLALMKQAVISNNDAVWAVVHQGFLPDARFFIGTDKQLYCSWNDACKHAGINNPYLEGSSLTKHNGPVVRGYVLKLVNCIDLINQVLNQRRVRREKVQAFEQGIYQVLKMERDAGRVINKVTPQIGD